MSWHTHDLEVYQCDSAEEVQTILDENKERLGFYVVDLYQGIHSVFVVLAFPKKLKGQRVEGSNSYDYHVGSIMNGAEFREFLRMWSSKIGFYIFKSAFIRDTGELIVITATTNPKVLEDAARNEVSQNTNPT
jgi:hypothetical protein